MTLQESFANDLLNSDVLPKDKHCVKGEDHSEEEEQGQNRPPRAPQGRRRFAHALKREALSIGNKMTFLDHEGFGHD